MSRGFISFMTITFGLLKKETFFVGGFCSTCIRLIQNLIDNQIIQ
jgi:hypothetical protein